MKLLNVVGKDVTVSGQKNVYGAISLRFALFKKKKYKKKINEAKNVDLKMKVL